MCSLWRNAALLTDASIYRRDCGLARPLYAPSCPFSHRFLVLSDSDFQGGIACGLHEDIPKVVGRLKQKCCGYVFDSNLESLPDPGRGGIIFYQLHSQRALLQPKSNIQMQAYAFYEAAYQTRDFLFFRPDDYYYSARAGKPLSSMRHDLNH